jgi:hypothetical protein
MIKWFPVSLFDLGIDQKCTDMGLAIEVVVARALIYGVGVLGYGVVKGLSGGPPVDNAIACRRAWTLTIASAFGGGP